MNELPTEKRCKDVILTHRIDKIPIYFTDSEAQSAREWAIVRGIDTRHMNHADLASRILSEHYGAASTLPERDEATGTGPATADRPADVWRESAGTIEQRDGKRELRPGERWATPEEQKAYEKHLEESTRKPEPELELTPDERWAKQMDTHDKALARTDAIHTREEKICSRLEAMITKCQRLQHEEERLQIQRENQQDKFEQVLCRAEKLVAMAIAKFSQPTAADIDRTQELAKERGWAETAGGMISPKPEPKITKTYTDAKAYEYSQGGYTKEQEIQDLRAIVEDQNAIIKEYEKRLEAGRKRGQMVRDLLSQEV